jgi:hypothetical protein
MQLMKSMDLYLRMLILTTKELLALLSAAQGMKHHD